MRIPDMGKDAIVMRGLEYLLGRYLFYTPLVMRSTKHTSAGAGVGVHNFVTMSDAAVLGATRRAHEICARRRTVLSAEWTHHTG